MISVSHCSVTKLVCRLGLLDEPEDGDLYWRLLMKSSLEQKDMVEMQWSQSIGWQILLPGKHCLENSLHRLHLGSFRDGDAKRFRVLRMTDFVLEF